MKYTIFKLVFLSGVHFGNGMLNDSESIFRSDSLFSALYIEALKQGVQDEFYQCVQEGTLRLSDAMPYVGEEYMIPKPILYIEAKERGDSEEKKKIKKLKYLFVSDLKSYLSGNINLDKYKEIRIGDTKRQTKAAITGLEETKPYHVGEFYFAENSGLYVIIGYENETAYDLISSLLESLSYTGIGGEKSSGLGKFRVLAGKKDEVLFEALEGTYDHYVLLSTAMPEQSELEDILEGSTYLLLKRSGFVYSETFAENGTRKEDMFLFAAGSCFRKKFKGDIVDVRRGGTHPVYRCGKAMLLGLRI